MKVYIYVHGKFGSASESILYQDIIHEDVIGLDYHDNESPYVIKDKLRNLYDELSKKYDEINVIGNSIGCYFVYVSLFDKKVDRTLFISPFLNLERFILSTMKKYNISIDRFKEEKIIPIEGYDPLDYDFYKFVIDNRVKYCKHISVVYGLKGEMVSFNDLSYFINENDVKLTLIRNGHHYFKEDFEVKALKEWIRKECNV